MAKLGHLLLCCTSLAAIPQIAIAQTASDTAPPEQSSEVDATQTGLQDIIVTATRRSVDLQKVSGTIVALTSQSLKALNVEDVLDLPALVPGLIAQPSGGNNLFLRGVGSASTGFNEAQTAVYIDGLYLANPAAGITSFNNVERIEVLKGPQGTLYGRNVTGGLISVITKDPSFEPHADMSFGYGNYDTATMKFYGSTALSDTVAGSVAVYGQRQDKGWTRNLFLGTRDQQSEEIGVQAKLLWRPGDGTKISTSFIYDGGNRDFGFVRQSAPGTLASDGTPYLGRHRYVSRIDPESPYKIYIGTLKIEQDLGFATLMSLSGYQKSGARTLFGGAQSGLGQPRAGLGTPTNDFLQHDRAFSQEFQLTSAKSDSRLDWVAGAFYFDDKSRLRLDTYNTCVGTVCAPGFTPTRNEGRPTTKSYSAYGDATYRILDATKLTVGVRYTDETRRLSGLLTPLAGRPNSVASIPIPAGGAVALMPGQPFSVNIAGRPVIQPGIATKKRFDAVTYRIVLAQDFGENVHAYLSHNYGFKSGAFNANAFNNPAVDPEKLYAYEAGVKSELFDRRLRLNVSYFHYDYKDVQIRSSAPPAPAGNVFLLNIAKSTYDGVDVDFNIAAAQGLTINGGFEYLDARFKDYPGASCITPGTGTASGVTIGLPVTVTCNLAGFQVPNAPKFSGAIGFTYAFQTGAGKFSFSTNDRFNVSYPMTPGNEIRQASHHIVDASLLWTSPDRSYDINLWARNIGGEYMYLTAQAGRDFIVSPGAPRTYGATIGIHF